MNALNRTVVAPLSSAIIAVLLAGLIVVGVDSVDRKLRPGEARLDASGVVEVSVSGGPFVRAAGNSVLSRNDRVRVREGSARLELPGDSTVELRKGSTVTVGTGTEAVLVLEEGDLLVEAPKETLLVDGGTALVSVAGAAKLRRGASLAAGVYKGNLLFHKAEQSLAVPTYRQAVAAGTGLLPASPQPLVLRSSDSWDLRMLPQVLDIDEELGRIGREFEAKLPPELALGPELFRQIVPGLADAPVSPELLSGRAPAENVIGLVLVALDRDGDFPTRVKRIFGFRSEGASWGLVAAERELNPNPVLGNLELAVGALGDSPVASSPELAKVLGGIVGDRGVNRGATTGPGGAEGASPADGGASTSPPGPGAPISPPGGGGTTPPTITPPGGENPPPPPPKRVDLPSTGTLLDPLLEPIVDPLENLLSGLLDGLLGTTPESPAVASEPAPPPATTPTTVPATTTTTTRPGLVGGLLNTVGGVLGG